MNGYEVHLFWRDGTKSWSWHHHYRDAVAIAKERATSHDDIEGVALCKVVGGYHEPKELRCLKHYKRFDLVQFKRWGT